MQRERDPKWDMAPAEYTSVDLNPDTPVPVQILLPEHWLGVARYRLIDPLIIAGYKVPPGFITDGASVPRIVWSVFPPVGRYLLAAIVHDHALESGKGWRLSNALFDECLRGLGIRGWRRVVMVAAVRANGVWQHIRHRLGLGGRHVTA